MMIRNAGLFAMGGAVALMLAAGPVQAGAAETVQLAQAAPAMAPDRIYMMMTCVACHGKEGKGMLPGNKPTLPEYPVLAGQDEAYMVAQINDIIEGKRTGSNDATGNPRSHGMKGALLDTEGKPRISKDQIQQISAWLAKMDPIKPAGTPDAQKIEEGKKLYVANKCQTCHGVDGKKPTVKGYPQTAGQKKEYILIQIKDIRDGKRTNGKSKLMLPNVKNMTDQQMELVAEYLSQVDRTAK
ncbi:MAG: c-type cytochrome [Magnetospirillum sp. WYHS-4]